MRISDWSSDVCSSDLRGDGALLACRDRLRCRVAGRAVRDKMVVRGRHGGGGERACRHVVLRPDRPGSRRAGAGADRAVAAPGEYRTPPKAHRAEGGRFEKGSDRRMREGWKEGL